MLFKRMGTRELGRLAIMMAGGAALALALAPSAFAQSKDFFSNTQLLGQRSNGSDGRPGFNPCGTGTASADGCGGTASANALLNPLTIDLFGKAGPGALTDNMFGKIERPVNPDRCSAGPVGTNTLNCGNARFDPDTQGQTIPTAGSLLSSAMTVNNPLDMESGTGTDAHIAMQFENGFAWNPNTGGTATVPINSAAMPFGETSNSCAAAPSAGNPTVCSQQGLTQTTAMGGGKESTLRLSTSFSTNGSNVADSNSFVSTPTVSWKSRIVQEDMVGGGTFDQNIEGSFEYGTGGFEGSSQPSGQSQTIRAGNLPIVAIEVQP